MRRKSKSIAELYPHLVDEWNYDRNNGLTPREVTPGMHRKVWWKCLKNPTHEWLALISNRARSEDPRGCPYCSNHLLNEDNCLATVNPKLSEEWCYELNLDITPRTVQAGGKQIVWWQCNHCGHRWKAQIYQRNLGHYRCKRCRSLAYNYPDMAKDWDSEKNNDLDPWIISVGSKKVAWWKCSSCGYRWKATVMERTQGHKTCTGCRSIAVTHPEVAMDWCEERNGELTPFDLTFGSNKIVWWICSRNPMHVTKMSVASRCSYGCPICSKGRNTSIDEITLYLALRLIFKNALHRYNYLGQKDLEMDIYIPSLSLGIEYDSYYFHKDKIVHDQHKSEHLSSYEIRLIRLREAPLPRIQSSNVHNIVFKRGQLKESFDAILGFISAKYQLDLSAVHVSLDSVRLDAMTYIASIPQEECLAYNYPELVSEWHPTKNKGLTPWDVRPYSNDKVWWQCSVDPQHEWQATVAKRTGGRKCPYCFGTGSAIIVDGRNSLEACFREIASQWHPTLNGSIHPKNVYKYSTKSYWWQCPKDKGHVWRTPVAKRTRLGRGCHYCTKQKVITSESVAILRPDLITEWDFDLNVKLDPTCIGTTSRRMVWWKCRNGHGWQDSILSRTNGKGQCPHCK